LGHSFRTVDLIGQCAEFSSRSSSTTSRDGLGREAEKVRAHGGMCAGRAFLRGQGLAGVDLVRELRSEGRSSGAGDSVGAELGDAPISGRGLLG